jgi:uncharacterized protein YeaO (DUF488 family)
MGAESLRSLAAVLAWAYQGYGPAPGTRETRSVAPSAHRSRFERRSYRRSRSSTGLAVRAKRVYDAPARSDGHRYLIDRLWPRGRTKEDLRLTEWLKELAPSPKLRIWFGHDPQRYATFRTRYRAELERRPDLIGRLVREARTGTVTLLFAARDAEHCNASVLRELLVERLRGRSPAEGARAPPAPTHARRAPVSSRVIRERKRRAASVSEMPETESTLARDDPAWTQWTDDRGSSSHSATRLATRSFAFPP